MPNKSAPKKRGRKAEKLSPVGRGVAEGLKEVLAHVRGENKLPVQHIPGRVDVKAVRDRLGMSQAEFADRFGFTLRTLQDWELGRSHPPSPVRAYLLVVDQFPKTVEKALGAA